jgi:hypothetical protein
VAKNLLNWLEQEPKRCISNPLLLERTITARASARSYGGEFLSGEVFYPVKKLRVFAGRWRVHYNTVRLHSLRGYRSPAGRVADQHPKDISIIRCTILTISPVEKSDISAATGKSFVIEDR